MRTRKLSCSENIWLHNLDPEFFQNQIVTGDETYLHHYEPEIKRQSIQWLTRSSRPPVKAIRRLSKKKVMSLSFWDRAGVILVKFSRNGETMTGVKYAKILGELKRAIQSKRGEKWDDGVFLIHDNAPCHASRVAQSEVSELGFVQLDLPPYSPDLAPSDYHLFPKLKTFLRKRTFTSDTQLEKSAVAWLARQPLSFYEEGISALTKRWEKCVRLGGTYVEK
jgi:histone-lysine N-methyltransferase SETMAR